MQCVQCGENNPERAKFCIECGIAFVVPCPQCTVPNSRNAKLCTSCGVVLPVTTNKRSFPRAYPVDGGQGPLTSKPRLPQSTLDLVTVHTGERKMVTALFADLKGSTALIEDLDPEEARAIIDPALQVMMTAVHRYGGYVAQALGDGIFALFGAPSAHEDHPQRAVYTALRMQEEMRRYADTLRAHGYPPLLLRVGINTGEVVMRSLRTDDSHTEYTPVGHAVHLAARMEQLASPGGILISEETYRFTDGYFAFKDLGETLVKGVKEPLKVYEVLRAGPLRTRFQVAARRGLTRFIGRQRELEHLKHALAEAKEGCGQQVEVMGEPGLGKSRLFYEFIGGRRSAPLHAYGCLVLESYSVSYGKASPYLPIIELLKRYCEIQLQDEDRTRRQKVIGKVLELDRSLEDTLPYLFALLGIAEQPSPLQQMDPQLRRRRTFDALNKLFLRESRNQPLILVFEDLHWIDNETQGFLDLLGEHIVNAHILLLTNYRPEYRHDWGQRANYTQLRLAPFGRAEAEEFLDELLGEKGGPITLGRGEIHALQQLKHLILDKSEGTPFFMEEIVQELIEEGVLVRDARLGWVVTHPVVMLQLPTTVQGILAARIDRLVYDEKALLQQVAVIGREFPVSLAQIVLAQTEEDLERLLSALQQKGFLYEQPAFPEVKYLFRHALTQEVAYNTVLHEQRKVLHERTAQAIETLYPATLEEHYDELAHHYRRAGNTEKAVAYLRLAGEQTVRRSALEEAIAHFTAALELLPSLPETPERESYELLLYLALGPPLLATRGYAAPEVEQSYSRALELCRQGGEPEQLFQALGGLWEFYAARAKLRTVRALAEQFLALAQNSQDLALLLGAHNLLGQTSFLGGEFLEARDYHEQGIALYDPQRHAALAFLFGGEDPGVACQKFAAWTLWLLGYPEQARQRMQATLSLAQELNSPFNLAFALNGAALFHQLRREVYAVQERADAGMTLAKEQGFAFFLAMETVLSGWALTKRGQGENGITQIRHGLAAYRATGAEVHRAYLLALLAEAYAALEQPEEGLTVLNEALGLVNETGERFYEAELYRLKGELLLRQEVKSQNSHGKSQKLQTSDPRLLTPDAQGEAEACFLQAINIAHQQQAKSFELRAAMSLVRLRQSQVQYDVAYTGQNQTRTKLAEAHCLLSDAYHWFTEGFDTMDLQEAKALIESLSE